MDIFRNARQNFLRRQAENEQADLERQQAREDAMRLQSQDRQQPGPEMTELPSPLIPPAPAVTGPSPASTVFRRFGDLPRPSMPSFLTRQSNQESSQLGSFPRPTSSYYTSHYSSSRFSEDGDDEESRVGFPPQPRPAVPQGVEPNDPHLRRRYDLAADDDEEGSPKTPQFAIGMPPLPSTRLHLTSLQRTWTQGSNGPPSRPGTSLSHHFHLFGNGGHGHHSENRDQLPLLEDPVPAVPATHIHGHSGAELSSEDFVVVVEDNEDESGATNRHHHRRHRSRRRRFNGTDPAEVHLMEMAEEGRQRRQRRRNGETHTRAGHHSHHRRRHHRHNRERNGANGTTTRGHSRSNSNSNSNSNRRRERRHRRQRHHDAAAAAQPGGDATAAGSTEDSSSSSRRSHKHPKHFLWCFPWIRSFRIRSYIVRCVITSIALMAMVGIYLALVFTKAINNNEFSILLLLIILFTALFLFHGFVRLAMLLMRPKAVRDKDPEHAPGYGLLAARGRQHHANRNRGGAFEQDSNAQGGGYAIPRQPIRVMLARDEEAAGIESVATKVQPPAYGLWRESVRVDPNRIYWQRNDATEMNEIDEMALAGRVPVGAQGSPGMGSSGNGAMRDSVELSAHRDRSPAGPHSQDGGDDIGLAHGYGSVRRPPSYASEDGVSYVVDAQPRSMAPTAEIPLALHPAEAGRGGLPVGW